MAEDDLLPAALPAELECIDHRAKTNIAIADRGAGLGIDVAADENGCAAGKVIQRAKAGDIVQEIAERKFGIGGATCKQGFAPRLNFLRSYGHRIALGE